MLRAMAYDPTAIAYDAIAAGSYVMHICRVRSLFHFHHLVIPLGTLLP